MSSSSSSRGVRRHVGLAQLGRPPRDAERAEDPLLVRRVGERAQRVDPGRCARALDQRGAEPLGRGDDELDRDALDRQPHHAALLGGQQRDDLGQLDEPGEDGPRVGRGAHDGKVLAVVAPAPRVAGHRCAERVRDPSDQLAGAVDQEPLPRPRLLRAGERLEQARLGGGSDAARGLQAAGERGVAQLARGPHVERAGDLQSPLRGQPQVAAEADEVRRELALEFGELGDRARLDELAQLRLDARADPAQLPHPPRAHEVRDRQRRAPDRFGGTPVGAGAVRVRFGELEEPGQRLESVRDPRVVHYRGLRPARRSCAEPIAARPSSSARSAAASSPLRWCALAWS